MYTDQRDPYRETLFNAWQKYQEKKPLDSIEAQLVEVILLHPEYHRFLNDPQQFKSYEFPLEENPFFHLSLHSAVRDQLRINRPVGILAAHAQLQLRFHHALDIEHFMMRCLVKVLWQAQQQGQMPNEQDYLQLLQGD